MPRFASVVLDVDSTVSGVEGIDWLAKARGPEITARIERLTERAMNGDLALEQVYGERLAIIRPSRRDVDALATVYRDRAAPGVARAVGALRDAGVRVVLVSGGIRQAIEPLASELGTELRAVSLQWNDAGEYVDFDHASPLVTQKGKEAIVRELSLARPALAVGDGSTDVAMRAAVDQFAAFTGFARRDAVVRAADLELASFDDLANLVLR